MPLRLRSHANPPERVTAPRRVPESAIMTRLGHQLALILAALAACSAPPSSLPPAPAPSGAPAAPQPAGELVFSIAAGGADNHFLRRGPASAHVVLSAGRVLVAFPAGDTGAALWLDDLPPTSRVVVEGPVDRPNGLHGVTAVLHVGARSLGVRDAVLGSLRAARGRGGHGARRAWSARRSPPGRR